MNTTTAPSAKLYGLLTDTVGKETAEELTVHLNGKASKLETKEAIASLYDKFKEEKIAWKEETDTRFTQEFKVLVTKDDLAKAKSELKEDISKLKDDLSKVKSELKEDISKLKDDLSKVKSEVEGKIADTRVELEKSIADTRVELEKSIADTGVKLEKSIADTGVELEKSIAQVRVELKEAIAQVRVELKESKSKMILWMFVFWATQMGAIVGIILPYLKK